MSADHADSRPNAREAALLSLIADGEGRLDLIRIDQRFLMRHPVGDGTIKVEVERLGARGWVEEAGEHPYRKWRITDAGRRALASGVEDGRRAPGRDRTEREVVVDD